MRIVFFNLIRIKSFEYYDYFFKLREFKIPEDPAFSPGGAHFLTKLKLKMNFKKEKMIKDSNCFVFGHRAFPNILICS